MSRLITVYIEKMIQYENLDSHIEELMKLENNALKVIKEHTNNYNKDTINQVLKHREQRG